MNAVSFDLMIKFHGFMVKWYKIGGTYETIFPSPTIVMSFKAQAINTHTCIIQIGRSLDYRNASFFKTVYQQQIQQGVRFFVLDFSETGILDSTGLGTIFYLYRQIRGSGGRVVFAAPSRPVQVVVQLTRAFKFFQQFVSIEEALDKLQQITSPPVQPILTQFKLRKPREA